MSVLTQYYKTTSTGTDGCRIVEPCCDFCRPTLLPSNWQRARILALISATDTLGPNNKPPAESVVPTTDLATRFYFGLSNGIFPGQTGAAFAGLVGNVNSDHPLCMANGYPNTSGFGLSTGNIGDPYIFPGLCNGSTLRTGSVAQITSCGFTLPETAANWGLALALDIDRSTAGNLYLSYANTSNLSAYTRLDMLALLAGEFTAMQSVTATVPEGMTHLFLYAPFTMSRLRVHHTGFIQLA